MTTVDDSITALRSISNAQAAADQTATLPAGAETLSVFELGDPDDSNAFIAGMLSHGVYNVTPPKFRSWTRLPTPLSQRTKFSRRKELPTWWLERFVQQD